MFARLVLGGLVRRHQLRDDRVRHGDAAGIAELVVEDAKIVLVDDDARDVIDTAVGRVIGARERRRRLQRHFNLRARAQTSEESP